MADSIILTTARRHQARLYSMDADFQGLDDSAIPISSQPAL
jgi:predicted nucleic acid-binding protein